jgi:hypothetical protein
MHARVQWSIDCVIHYWISIHQSNTTQATKFGCTDTNFEIDALISTWRLSVDDFKRMNNESYIGITLSNLAALLAHITKIWIHLRLARSGRVHIRIHWRSLHVFLAANDLCKPFLALRTSPLIKIQVGMLPLSDRQKKKKHWRLQQVLMCLSLHQWCHCRAV